MSDTIPIFALASGRSGTSYIADFFKRNVPQCKSLHEPLPAFKWLNPPMFGKPIYDYATQQWDHIRPLLVKKKRYIERIKKPYYLESNHALLKSAGHLLPEFFPNARYLHLVRNPIKVAKSEANRELYSTKYHSLFYYHGDDRQRYFHFRLTGKEPIFQSFDVKKIDLFTFYIIQWIEIENRAMQLIKQVNQPNNCYTLHAPNDLNDLERLQQMLIFFGLYHQDMVLNLAKKINKTPGYPTQLSAAEEDHFNRTIKMISPEYLAIFKAPPYTQFEWCELLCF